jgi:hypothetical protein
VAAGHPVPLHSESAMLKRVISWLLLIRRPGLNAPNNESGFLFNEFVPIRGENLVSRKSDEFAKRVLMRKGGQKTVLRA